MLQTSNSVPTADYREADAFARVWNRVMPEDRPDCPFVTNCTPPPAEEDAPMTQEEVQPPQGEAGGALCPCVPTPAPPVERLPQAPPVHVTPQSVADNDIPCLGAASAVYGGMLQKLIDQEIANWKRYLALSRRSPAGGSRVLAAIAAAERRHGKRLSAAYFLISGVRYWPADRKVPPLQGAWPSALRQCFCGEQKAAAAYLAAAAENSDPALCSLFQELAGEEALHAQTLRELLEQL